MEEYEDANKALAEGLKVQAGIFEEYDFNEDNPGMQEAYNLIEGMLRKYCDLQEEYYNIITLWIMGTYIHKQFMSYPYLFFNAMKGSGKTRLLKLVASLSYNGKIVGTPSEAVLFRSAATATFCIDEFESVGGAEKGALRELLNAAYKKGMAIERAKKISTKGVETYAVESFDVFCPIAMANIWGMEEVLADRCLSLVLERSNDPVKTRLMEIDGFNKELRAKIMPLVSLVSMSLCPENLYNGWNTFVSSGNITTLTTHTTTTTQTTQTTHFFSKVYKTGITSRHLELFFPLFIISKLINNKIFEKTLKTASKLCNEKKDEDTSESKDVVFFSFLADMGKTKDDWIKINYLTNKFAEYVDDETSTKGFDAWLNNKWVGRALKRLKLVLEKVRKNEGREVRIDFDKAKERIGMFKVVEEQV